MSEQIKIFLSYSYQDLQEVEAFSKILKGQGYFVWLYHHEILPGDDLQVVIDEAINNCNVFLFFLSRSYVKSSGRKKEVQKIMAVRSRYSDKEILTIPIRFESILSYETPDLLRTFVGIDFGAQGLEKLIKALSKFEERLQENSSSSAQDSFLKPETNKNLLVSAIELTNVRCFEKLSINLLEDDQPIEWAMLLGDNAAGKSTILKSIALGLCNESEATALLAEMSGSFIRQDTDECCIKISLKEVEQASDQEKSQDTERLQSLSRALLNAFPTPSKLQKMVRLELDSNLLDLLRNFRHGLSEQVFVVVEWAESQGKVQELIDAARRANPDNLSLKQLDQEKTREYTITTEIIKQSEDSEIVRKTIEPDIDFLWSDIFICGYGANRSSQTFGSYESYQASDAVKSLFSSQVHFQNPELVLLRQNPKIRHRLESLLLEVLGLDDSEYQISYTDRGIELDGAWGRQPLEVLSDGYRTTTEWILDFVGWLVQSNRLSNSSSIGGILLIDEIEQHLHPRWQRYIVQRLREQFPQTQIIASTHTPLVASGIVDVASGILLKLDRDETECFGVQVIDKNSLDGKRADQILASEAFGLATTRNPGSQDKIDRYVELLSITTRTEAEEAEVQQLKSQIQDTMQPGESSTAQLIAKKVSETLQEAGESISPELLDLQINQQLQKLSRSDI